MLYVTSFGSPNSREKKNHKLQSFQISLTNQGKFLHNLTKHVRLWWTLFHSTSTWTWHQNTLSSSWWLFLSLKQFIIRSTRILFCLRTHKNYIVSQRLISTCVVCVLYLIIIIIIRKKNYYIFPVVMLMMMLNVFKFILFLLFITLAPPIFLFMEISCTISPHMCLFAQVCVCVQFMF